MKNMLLPRRALCPFFFLFASGICLAAPLSSAFTYQGRLNSGGIPATGSYDLVFTLHDAASAGSQVGGTLTNAAAGITNGLFTVTLDFGAGIFDGSARWLQVGVRTNGAASFVNLAPRQMLAPAPGALFAASAGTATSASVAASATTADSVAAGSVGTSGLAVGAVDSSRIADGSVAVADLSPAVISNTFWRLGGNVGTTPGMNFVGTIDSQPLELRVNNAPVLRLEPGPDANLANLIGGTNNSVGGWESVLLSGRWNTIQSNVFAGFIGGGWYNSIQSNAIYSVIGQGYNNSIQTNAQGAVIAGGMHNVIKTGAQLAVIGGGYLNTNGGSYAAIPGGYRNAALGSNSFAAGRRAKAHHDGAFVWADYQNTDFVSTAPNQFLIRATNGVGINTNNPGTNALLVNGTVAASNFAGNGGGLTNLNASQLASGTVGFARLPSVLVTNNQSGVTLNALTLAGITQVSSNLCLNDKDILLRIGNDPLHGLGWYGNPKFFGGENVNGPVLYGNNGGALGAKGGTTNIALQWDASRKVTIGGTLNLISNLVVNDKEILLRNDANHGLGWYGNDKPFAGLTLDGPFLYGYGGGGLGVVRSGNATNIALTWDSSGNVGIRKANPATSLDVNGTVTATAFSGSGAGVTGTLLQANSLTSSEPSLATAAANTWTKLGDLATFTKQTGATVELTYNGRLTVGNQAFESGGVVFELRVDDNPTTVGLARGEVMPNEKFVRISITGIFRGLNAGSHTASMWVKPLGDVSNVHVGATPLYTSYNNLIIKEYK